MTNNKLFELIRSSKVHQIRAGKEHGFIDITIVETGGRLFVRQYKFARRSWYDAFINNPEGELKCGDVIIPIKGVIPWDLEHINQQVTTAFWRKLHIIYGIMRLGFNTRKHEASTMELIPVI